MYNGIKIAALIPARKGSKGVPNKNIVELMGIPLIAHTIMQAKESKLIDKVIVSSDSEIILEIANEYGVDFNGLRPNELSDDTSIIYDVLKYEIVNHDLQNENFEIIILLQPTSPLRQTYMIDESLIAFIDQNLKSSVSISEVEEHPIFMRTINNSGTLDKILRVDSTVRRQDLPKVYKVNGMIYINKISDILNNFISLNDNTSPIVIPKEFCIDIDCYEDFAKAEKALININSRRCIDLN